MTLFDKYFWDNRYKTNDIGWDLGAVSPPIQTYVETLTDTSLKILIPGGGNSYELEFLIEKGFKQSFVLDISPLPLANIAKRNPSIPTNHLLCGDFFEHSGLYDIIFEQTFFCALDPILRQAYVKQMHRLLKPGGKLVGLLFDAPLNDDKPPFGGNADEYKLLFSDVFEIRKMEPCTNSIQPRMGRELFIEFIAR
jgi:methyl halide transferase